jgi:uncharacterized membrane protein (DUF4010 family)
LAFVSVLGMLSAHMPAALAAVAFAGVLLLIAASDVRSSLSARPLELTTSMAVLLVFVAGYLVGIGHVFTPVASAILITMLLAWKVELRKVAGGLTLAEIRSAVLLGLLGFVIYPVIPDRFVDPWQLINPRAAWVIVIVIAGIGFVNYVLLKLYGTRGIYLSGFLGGLVNSTAATELARPFGAGSTSLSVAVAALLLTILANPLITNMKCVSNPGSPKRALFSRRRRKRSRCEMTIRLKSIETGRNCQRPDWCRPCARAARTPPL